MKWRIVFLALVADAIAICLMLVKRPNRREAPYSFQEEIGQSSTSNVRPQPTFQKSTRQERTPVSEKTAALKKQAVTDFETLLRTLQPYGENDGTRQVYVQLRTNNAGGVSIEVEVRSATHKGTFIAGPYDSTDGSLKNANRTDAPFLRLFEALYDGSDTRRNPDAVNGWYQATGKWTEAEAVEETFRLMQAMGMPTNQVTRHRFRASAITVKDREGNSVRVTPFYTVQMCDKNDDDYSYILGVQYRIGQSPPAHVTRWESWPPVKVPQRASFDP